MEVAIVVVGAFIVLLTLYDMFNTTISLGGGGPLSARMNIGIWKRLPWGPGPLRGSAGGILSLCTILVWMALLWLGWTLIFLPVSDAVLRASSGEPADFAARIYFSGFTLFTLGLGDYRPDGALWQILTALCVATGFLSVTMSATYLVPMLSAAAHKRAVASMIDSMGDTPEEIVINGWRDGNLLSLGTRLASLSAPIAGTAASHLSYPILHTFGTAEAGRSMPVQIVKLSEALLLVEHGIAPEARPAALDLLSARRSLTEFFEHAGSGARMAEEVPPTPDLERLGDAGLPTVALKDFESAMERQRDMRRYALGMLRESGWSIKDALGR
ncbi:ion channel [Pseudooceanicola nanhaiensis]|uniref:ion channel n=1 Tax=Pseudooceanicola nanhaiensis TaxID=375761 RepID=UPI0035154846